MTLSRVTDQVLKQPLESWKRHMRLSEHPVLGAMSQEMLNG